MAVIEGYKAVIKYLLNNSVDIDRTKGSSNIVLLYIVYYYHPKV